VVTFESYSDVWVQNSSALARDRAECVEKGLSRLELSVSVRRSVQYFTVVPNDSAVRRDRGIPSSNVFTLLGHCISLEFGGHWVSCDHRNAVFVVAHHDHFQVANHWIWRRRCFSSVRCTVRRVAASLTCVIDYPDLPYRLYCTVLYRTVHTVVHINSWDG